MPKQSNSGSGENHMLQERSSSGGDGVDHTIAGLELVQGLHYTGEKHHLLNTQHKCSCTQSFPRHYARQ